MNNMKAIPFFSAGFTLVETIISIAILTVAFLGPLSVATRSLSSSSVSTNQIIAYNLAEEGMEYMINKRDSMIFADAANGWSNFINATQGGQCQTGGGKNGCSIDLPTDTLIGCGSSNNNDTCSLHKNSSTGLYSHTASDLLTIFVRRIYVQPGAGDDKKVTVTLTWVEKSGSTRSFTLERSLFNRK